MSATYHGVLTFHSETGTEGGAWAFQDEKFMGLDAGQKFRCTRCGRVWDKDREAEPPKPMFTYWQDADSTYAAGYRVSDTFQPDGNLGPNEVDQEFTRRTNEVARQCEDGHAEWEDLFPTGMWSYEGLHILRDGDHLTVWDEDENVVFDGVVELPPRQDPYAEGAYAAGGYLAAHRRPPVGTKEEWWFGDTTAATLTTDTDPVPAPTQVPRGGLGTVRRVRKPEE